MNSKEFNRTMNLLFVSLIVLAGLFVFTVAVMVTDNWWLF